MTRRNAAFLATAAMLPMLLLATLWAISMAQAYLN